jgi:SAM-dependent methyltransferase
MMKIYGDKIYEKQFSTIGWGTYPSEEVIRFFMYAKKKINHKLVALDIGCGIGSCSWLMAKEGATVTAMDGSPTGLDMVNKTARSFGINKSIKTLHGDITNPLELIKSKFNIILDSYALYSNMEDQVFNGYKGCYELLGNGGFFLTCCFGKKTDGYEKGEQLSENTYTKVGGALSNGGVQTFFGKDFLINNLIQIGFKLEYYENILEDRTGGLIEKHIACFTK